MHWRGSGSDHDSWEPDVNLKNAPQIVQSYWDGLKSKGLEVPWNKPTFTSTVTVAQRRGRVVEASTSQAKTTSPIPMSRKRRTRRKQGKRALGKRSNYRALVSFGAKDIIVGESVI